MRFRRTILALALFGIAFGYVEAAVVVYLRAFYDPVRARLHPERPPEDLFPMITPEQMLDAGPQHARLLRVEIGREFATLLMLAAAALAVSRNARQWTAAFAMVFGVWDLAFYAFLKAALGWPPSLFAWDILFLLPGPWAGPVIAPALAAVSMIAAGALTLYRDAVDEPILLRGRHWTLIFGGALVMVASFLWDWRNTIAGNWPNPFNWPLFWTGEVLGLGAFLWAWRRSNPRPRPRRSG